MLDVKTVAFDLGGVLVSTDYSCLSTEEQLIFDICMRKRRTFDLELEAYAKKMIASVLLKCYKLRPDAIKAMDMLKSWGIPMSLWTNNIKELNIWLEEVGMLSYIPQENVINSFYVGYDKPDIRYYNLALKILNTSPLEVLFWDDNYLNVINARSCQIRAEQFFENDNLQRKLERILLKK